MFVIDIVDAIRRCCCFGLLMLSICMLSRLVFGVAHVPYIALLSAALCPLFSFFLSCSFL